MLSAAVRHTRRLTVSVACVAAFSSTTAASAAPAVVHADPPIPAPVPTPAPAPVVAPGLQVASLAQQYVGSRYVWGGSSPSGFDCTGFVMWVFSQFGVAMPHNEAGQLASGDSVDAENLQPGDVLVFANTYRRGLSHVGIYVGGGQFIHAMDESHGVIVSSLSNSYWAVRLVGATRALA